jgi:hypothetical protein
MKDLPVYLLSARLDHQRRDVVHVNIRLSGEPEGTARTNEIPLERFKEILVKTFKFTPYDVDREIGEMKIGHGDSCNLSMTENGLHKTGLLNRYQSG